MGILRTNTISGIGSDGPIFDGVTKFDTQGYVVPPTGTTDQRSAGITTSQGTIRFNTDSQKLEFYAQDQWWEMVIDTPDLGVSSNTGAGARGIFPGGRTGPSSTNTIDYITISSTGNALDFGDLTVNTFELGACSSSTRGLMFGGRGPAYVNTIQYVTISSTGDTADFGDLASTQVFVSGVSNSTRGVIMGGLIESPYAGGTNNVDYVTIASTGNAQDFGNLSFNYPAGMNQISSSTRGFFTAGFAPHNGPPGAPSAPSFTTNIIQYITIASLGNSQDFGDMQQATSYNSGCSNATRGVYAGNGTSPSSKIEFITMATLGNTVTFGNLTSTRLAIGACASSTRGVFGGGGDYSNVIDYVNILTQGDAVDFGDLQSARGYNSAFSNAHGGL